MEAVEVIGTTADMSLLVVVLDAVLGLHHPYTTAPYKNQTVFLKLQFGVCTSYTIEPLRK